MDKLKIEYKGINDLIPYINNPRLNDGAVDKVASSIKNFGFKNPVIIDKDNEIIAGHTRLKAARKLGLDEVPTIKVEDLTDNQIKAFRIADNKTSEFAEWDFGLLEIELEGLDDEFTGFDMKELDDMFPDDTEVIEDDFDEEPPEEPISKRGDIWLLGRHRLMCGDSTDKEQVNKLIGNTKIETVFTDPPYGISIVSKDGSVGGGTKGKYKPIEGDDTIEVALKAIDIIFELNPKNILIWGGNYFSEKLKSVPSWIIWDKQGGKHVTFADCEMAWTNTMKPARIYQHIWDGFRRDSERGVKRVHPTQKPIKLCEESIKEVSSGTPKTVLDLFGGSGSTLMACEQIGSSCYMMELDEKYVDVIVNRYIKFKESDEDVFLIRDGVQIPYKEVEKNE